MVQIYNLPARFARRYFLSISLRKSLYKGIPLQDSLRAGGPAGWLGSVVGPISLIRGGVISDKASRAGTGARPAESR